MKFSQMPYSRVDLEETRAKVDALILQLSAATDYAEARAAFLAAQELYSHVQTMRWLTYARHTIDTNDEFYSAEEDHYDEIIPHLEELQKNFKEAVLASPFRADFEQEFGSVYFKNAEILKRSLNSAIIADRQEENRLTTEYVKLIASAQISFDGKTLTLAQMSPYLESIDRGVRAAAWHAYGEYFDSIKTELDQLFDQLVAVRTRIGHGLGHADFIPAGYDRMIRNCYDETKIARFRESIQKHIVPIAAAIKQAQAQRTGVPYPLSFVDSSVMFPSGNPVPFGTPDEILAHGQKMYRELSSETAEFMDFMMDNELFDVLARPGKAAGGYCVWFPNPDCPFIFANFNGTAGDVEVITHEAGHAFADYRAKGIMPLDNHVATYESCEIHSMSMEFFAWPWCEGFFGKDTQKYFYQHLAGALLFLPYGAMVDHFQHEIYRNPGMTPAERHALWMHLESVYRPWIKDTEIPFFNEGRAWQRQIHIYELPFYYIDYCLAQTVALQFWGAMQQDRDGAWNRYMKLVSKAGTKTFTELVAIAGMDSPFEEAALKSVAEAAAKWLADFDSSALV